MEQPGPREPDGADYETVLLEIAGSVATVTLNRPEVLNAFNQAMVGEFRRLWGQVRADDGIHVVVLRAAGERAFSTGVDVNEGFSRPGNPWSAQDPGEALSPKQNKVWKPVIAAVHGMVAGGAFYWLNDCDIIISADDATFFDPHVSYGLTSALEPIGLARRIPLGEALRWALLGLDERMSARRAREIGLVSELVPRAQLWERAAQIAAIIAAKPAAAVQGTVRAIWETHGLDRETAQRIGWHYTEIGNPIGKAEVSRAAFVKPRWELRLADLPVPVKGEKTRAERRSGEQVDDRLGLEVVLEQVLGGVFHMRAPVLLGSRRVPGPDQADELDVRADDPLEALVGVGVVAPRYLRPQVGGDDVLQDRALDGHRLVAAAFQDQLVKAVGQGGPGVRVGDEGLARGDLRLEVLHHLGELPDVLIGVPQRQQARARRLGDHPGLVDIVDGGALHLQQQADGAGGNRHFRGDDPGAAAAAAPHADQGLRLQDAECLAQRRARYAVLLHELAFRGKGLTRRQLAPHDLPPQVAGDQLTGLGGSHYRPHPGRRVTSRSHVVILYVRNLKERTQQTNCAIRVPGRPARDPIR
jgi:enoyl-CoA hydratase/carnithine racemase